MSDGTALATCTAVLCRMFQDALDAADLGPSLSGTPTVSALPPDRIIIGAGEQPQLNLFLCRVTPNTGWGNAELPSRAPADRRPTSPALALDLHYLVSAYGNAGMHGDVLLGHAALALHATPQLTRERMRALLRTIEIKPPALRKLVMQSGLADQEEAIRLTPENLGIDEIAKLWTAFREPYRQSFAFQASVVLMRPDSTHR